MMQKHKRILLIEDNEHILRGNKQLLEWEGYEVFTAMSLNEAHATLSSQEPDLIVLDLMLPDGSGLDFIRVMRNSSKSITPILILTGLNTNDDIVRGLSSGGDDYLTKPYDFPVLLARITAILRRAERVPETITKGGLSLNLTANAASLNGENLLLAQKEFALLLVFIQNEELFISSDYLYEKVWQAPMTGDSQALKSAISRLRDKLKGSGFNIVWVRGEGYSLIKE